MAELIVLLHSPKCLIKPKIMKFNFFPSRKGDWLLKLFAGSPKNFHRAPPFTGHFPGQFAFSFPFCESASARWRCAQNSHAGGKANYPV